MENATGNIIKSDNVNLEGQFNLNLGQPVSNQTNVSNPAAEPKVVIIENHPEYALMEVTCSCGSKTYIKCQYADGIENQ